MSAIAFGRPCGIAATGTDGDGRLDQCSSDESERRRCGLLDHARKVLFGCSRSPTCVALKFRSRFVFGFALALVGVGLLRSTSGAFAAVAEPTAYAAAAPPAVGALFTLAGDGALADHFCTATVVDSPRGDVIATAAHCLNGHVPGSFAFVPGYFRGIAPLGVWVVDEVFVDSAWLGSASPEDDFAFLIVSRSGQPWSLEALTGADRLGTGGRSGTWATVTGYPAAADAPISCQNALLAFSSTQLEFDCGGYAEGTSGSAVVLDPEAVTGLGTIVGVIGGYQQGGDTPAISYSAAFSPNTQALYQQAIAAQ